MNKHCLTFPLAPALLALSTAVAAQGSVTLYGVVSTNLTYTNNVQTAALGPNGPQGASRIAALDSSTSGPASSRWGIRGTEDIGNGLTALFVLEGGYNVPTGSLGQGGALFGRNAWVGLKAARIGTLSLGRQADSAVEFVSPLLYGWHFGNLNIHPADYDNLNFTHRINNSVKYVSDSFGGVRASALYSFGGVAGDVSRNQYWSAGLTYSGGPFVLAAAYVDARNPNVSLYGTNPNASATGNNLGNAGSASSAASNPSIAGFASAQSQRTTSVAGTYTVGPAIVGLVWSNANLRGLGATPALNPLGYSGNVALNTVGASVRYQVTPKLRSGISYDYTTVGGVNGQDGAQYGQLNLGGGYALSKRTELYAVAAYQHANGTDSLGRPAVAAIGYMPPSATSNQVALATGIKHTF